MNLEKSSLYQISSLNREVSRFSEDFQFFFTKIHDIVKKFDLVNFFPDSLNRVSTVLLFKKLRSLGNSLDSFSKDVACKLI